MARLFVTSINLNKNELQNARIQNLSSAPSSPVAGQVYFDTSDHILYFYDGTNWISTSGSLEVIQDAIGQYVVGGTGLTATYNDSAGTTTIDLDNTTVTASSYGDQDKTLSITVDAQGRLTSASANSIQIATSQITGLKEYVQDEAYGALADGEGINISYDDGSGIITISGEDASDTNKGIASFSSTDFTVSSGDVTIKDEKIQDVVGGMLTGNTETGITVTYEDSDGTIDFAVADQFTTHTTDNLSEGSSNKYFTDERAQDAVNTALTAGTGITKTYNDNDNTITIAVDTDVIATRSYVDTAVSGIAWKQAVNLMSTTNVQLFVSASPPSSPPQKEDLVGLVIDGHSALDINDAGYRLLLTGQSTDSENGIYELIAVGGELVAQRPADASTYSELIGAGVFVMEGTTYGTTSWIQSNHYLTDFENQEWVQFSGAGAYTAGAGLTQSGTTFNVGAGTGITVNANDVAIDTAVVARKYSTNVGDTTNTSYTITHNLGTKDVTVQVFEVGTPYAQVEADVEHSTTNTVTLKFAIAPTTDQYRVIVVG